MDELEVLLKLTDQMTGPARTAGQELAALERSIKRDRDALGELQAAQAAMAAKGEGSVPIKEYQKLQAAIESTKASLQESAGAYGGLVDAAKAEQAAADEVKAAKQAELAAARAAADEVKAAKQAELAAARAASAEIKAAKQAELAAARAATAEIKAAERAAKQEEQALQKAAKAAEKEEKALKKAADAAAKSAEGSGLKSSLEGGVNVVNSLAGSMGGLTGKANQAISAVAKLGPYGAAAAAAVVVALAAVVGAVMAVTAAFEAAFKSRDEALKLQGSLAAVAFESGKTAMSIKEVSSAVQSVAAGSALGADKIGEYASQLAKAGVKGDKLQASLKAMAEAGSAGGDASAQAFLKQAQAAGESGKALDDLIAKTHDAFGATAQAQALSFGTQIGKFKSSIGDLFSGANLEPFLTALTSVTSMFSQSTVTGRALKGILSGALEGIANAAKAVFPYIRSAIQNVIIIALKLRLAFLQFAHSDMGKTLIAGLRILGTVIKWVGIAMLATAAVFVAPFALLVAGAAAGAAAWLWMASKVRAAITWLIGHFTEIPGIVGGAISAAITWVGQLGSSAYAAAADLIQGLVNGITNGAGLVIDAIKGLGSSAMGALKSILGISSPSKVFAQYGGYTAEGFAQGVDAKSDVVESSVGEMGDVKPGSKGGGKGKVSSGGPVSIVFNLYATMSADEREKAREMILDIFESEALA